MASARSLGTLSVDLVAKTAGFTAGLDKAARDADKSMSKIEKRAYQFGNALGKGIKLAAVGFAAATTAVAALTAESINYADELQDLSGKLGISTEQLSKWAYVANLSGTDIDTVARSVNLLGKNLAAAADPTSKMGELFASLGIQVRDAAGNLRSAEDVLPEIADRFKTLDNQTTETALALQLFGKSGAELLEFLNRGSDGIKTLEDELASLGGVISSDTAKAAEEFKDELGKLKIMGQGLGLQIAQQLLPVLIETTKEFRQLVKDGGLATNIVSVLTGAFAAGVSIIEGYNIAVERTSLLFESAAKSATGAWEVYKNTFGFGFADGTILGGLQKMIDAPLEATAQAKQLQAIREAQAKLADFSGVMGGVTTQEERAAAAAEEAARAAQAKRLQELIDKFLSGNTTVTNANTAAKKEKNEVDREALKLQRELERQAEEEAEMYRESLRLIEDNIQAAKDVSDNLAFEVELMGLSNREREKAITLRGLELEGQLAYGKQIQENIDTLYNEMERVELMDGFRDSFQNFFVDVISGTQSVSDAFKSMLDDINAMILNRIAENWVDQLFGAMGTNQGGAAGGNWFSTFMGWFGAGKAGGGWAAPNTITPVNENGIEMARVGNQDYMLTGNKPAHVTPNHRLGGGVQQNNNFIIQGRIDRRTQDQIVQDVGRKTQTAMARNG